MVAPLVDVDASPTTKFDRPGVAEVSNQIIPAAFVTVLPHKCRVASHVTFGDVTNYGGQGGVITVRDINIVKPGH